MSALKNLIQVTLSIGVLVQVSVIFRKKRIAQADNVA